jgi:hypothetical protein
MASTILKISWGFMATFPRRMTPATRANRVDRIVQIVEHRLVRKCGLLRVQCLPPALPKHCVSPLTGAKLLAPVQLKAAGESLKVSPGTGSVKDRTRIENERTSWNMSLRGGYRVGINEANTAGHEVRLIDAIASSH